MFWPFSRSEVASFSPLASSTVNQGIPPDSSGRYFFITSLPEVIRSTSPPNPESILSSRKDYYNDKMVASGESRQSNRCDGIFHGNRVSRAAGIEDLPKRNRARCHPILFL